MSHPFQPFIKVVRDGDLLHVTPYASDGRHKRRLEAITVDMRDRPGAKEELKQHLDTVRKPFQS